MAQLKRYASRAERQRAYRQRKHVACPSCGVRDGKHFAQCSAVSREPVVTEVGGASGASVLAGSGAGGGDLSVPVREAPLTEDAYVELLLRHVGGKARRERAERYARA